jgi:hypothetical protein
VGNANGSAAAIAMIAAMITPGLLILGSASLVASALVRMARVVDRARIVAATVHEGTWAQRGATRDLVRTWLDRHARRARYAERSIALLYCAVVAFIATCLSIALDRATGGSLSWLPVLFAILGTLLLLAGGALMVAECRLSGQQIQEEIRHALKQMEEKDP